MTTFLARQQRFDLVASTNDVVRGWLADGTPEVCLVVADEQTAGRGRAGRTWIAPRGAAMLLSLGFRPTWLDPERAWRLAAITALAMAEAAEEIAGLADGAIRLKWPNDLVVETGKTPEPGGARKLAGLLGETDGLGTVDPRVVVGLGINVDWPAPDFPPELAGSMTSLHEVSGGRPIDLVFLLDAFLGRLEARVEALRGGHFDGADWQDRQLTTGRTVRLEGPAGSETVRAIGVNVATGALIVEDEAAAGGERQVIVGEVSHVRLAANVGALV
jgi:BirA family transcriptional regulator, biotin operon repressor / biotin---[acetyl-CoA-carboxylase] ligase